jgi:hypothetical protein
MSKYFIKKEWDAHYNCWLYEVCKKEFFGLFINPIGGTMDFSEKECLEKLKEYLDENNCDESIFYKQVIL